MSNRTRRATAAAIGGAAIFAAVASSDGLGNANIVGAAISGAALAAAAVCDLAERRIPNRVTVPAALLLLGLWAATRTPIGELAAGLIFAGLLVAIGFAWPAAIGMGDAKLALVIALGLTDRALSGLLYGFLLAALIAAMQIARQAGSRAAIPLGPFLAIGALIALVA